MQQKRSKEEGQFSSRGKKNGNDENINRRQQELQHYGGVLEIEGNQLKDGTY